MTVTFRPFAERDHDAVLHLNAESVAVLSPLNAERLRALRMLACLHEVAEDADVVVGFLLAFADGAPYDSINYQWFARRFKRFVYIDRVVVSAACRGAGVGRAFYRRALDYAAAAGCMWLVCEVDVEPPNAGSLAFHQRLGFVEVGRQTVGGGKVVSMQICDVDAPR
ncbi:MAG: GNAT family N-acetyltransferase [Chloroflexales bacterium]|nr:GNAT family N-acetyltransferase [Chloroflexales bacterium]